MSSAEAHSQESGSVLPCWRQLGADGRNWQEFEGRGEEVRLTIISVGEHFHCLVRKSPQKLNLRKQANLWVSF